MSPTVHVLLHGRVLCGNVHGVPASWGEVHMWTGLAEWQEATCQRCREVAEMLEESRQVRELGRFSTMLPPAGPIDWEETE